MNLNSNQSSKSGGTSWGTIIAVIIVIGLLISYWYIVLPIVVAAITIGYFVHKRKQPAAIAKAEQDAQKLEETHQQELNGSKVDQIRSYKQLLDEGAITQEEFDQQKRNILNGDDKLTF